MKHSAATLFKQALRGQLKWPPIVGVTTPRGNIGALAPHASKTGGRRCLLRQYPIILRWQHLDAVKLLVDRSYAQSFYDYISQLMSRWSATTA
jgi:hypothetical protein